MYDKAFEDLLKEYLTDGIITSKEREVLLRKAQELHYDVDEVDLYIDAQQQKYEQAAEAASAKKLGKVCPRCGKQVSELTVVCDCGYEFQDNKSEPSAIDILTDRIEKIRAQPINCLRSSPEYEKALAEKNNKIAEAIANCAVPNTKKGIIDFLSVAMANSTIKGSIWGTWSGRVKSILTIAFVMFLFIYFGETNSYSYYLPDSYDFRNILIKFILIEVPLIAALSFVAFKYNKLIIENEIPLAWRGKVTQTLVKGHTLQGDEEFSRQLDYFENQFNEKCKSSLVKILEVIFENLKKAFGGIKAYAEERQEAKKQAKELAKKQAEEQANKQAEEQAKEQVGSNKAVDNK